MKAVENLRAELEEEEQALGGVQEASMSEDAQSDEASSKADSESVQQAAAVGDDDSHQDHASLPELACTLSTHSWCKHASCVPSRQCHRTQTDHSAAGFQ